MSFKSIQKCKKQLPIYRAKDEIVEVVSCNKTVIFVGETASGKTTQIPQYLLESGIIGEKCMAITQPRRVAALTISKRVAEELRTELGYKVGYSVRFDNATSPETKIKYLTDGMLLRESIGDPLLSDYSVVMLDEAHERTLNNDILFGIVKMAQRKRKKQKLLPLKILVTSATMDYKQLSEYFKDAPVYFIRGREYSIKIFNSSKQEDYVWSALVTVFQIHQNEEEGDILVFATGQEEIESMVSEVEKTARSLPKGSLGILPYGLYAALPSDLQVEVFKKAPPGYRKVIFSTNIAETSVTIPGIKYVVDTGMVKARSYNSVCGLDILSVERVSKAQAEQRSGRAGREINGVCYRLYSVEEYNTFKDFTIPEILRCGLSTIILQMIAVGIKNIRKFDFIDKPSDESIDAALRQLMLLDAITEKDGSCELTEYGQKMVMFPVDPRFSKMIIKSVRYGCTDEILTIISLLSVETVFYSPSNMRDRCTEVRKKFESYEGDHFTLLNVYKAYKKAKGNPEWCEANYVNAKNMKRVISVRKQLSKLCEKVGIKPCSCRENWYIRKCLATGLFMNLAGIQRVNSNDSKSKNNDGKTSYITVEGKKTVKVHPGSSLFRMRCSHIMYTELVQTSEIYMRNVCFIDKPELKEVAPDYFKEFNLQHTL